MKTKVVFRKFKDGQVVALFPKLIWNNAGDIASYMHVGQHAGANRCIVNDTKPATRQEYEELYKELKSIGYDLEIGKRLTR